MTESDRKALEQWADDLVAADPDPDAVEPDPDAAAIRAALAHIDALAAETDRLRAENADLRDALRENDRLFEKIDEALATPERLREDAEVVGGFFSGLHLSTTADEIVDRVCAEVADLRSRAIPKAWIDRALEVAVTFIDGTGHRIALNGDGSVDRSDMTADGDHFGNYHHTTLADALRAAAEDDHA